MSITFVALIALAAAVVAALISWLLADNRNKSSFAAKNAALKASESLRESQETQNEKRIAELKSQNEKQIAELKSQNEKQIAELKSQNEKQIAELKSQNEKYVGELKAQHAKTVADLKDGYEKTLSELRLQQEKALKVVEDRQNEAIESAKTALALENEKSLKAKEESMHAAAKHTMEQITGSLNKDISAMRDAFEAQKKSHAEETSSLKTKFEETVKTLSEQTRNIGHSADNLANALKGHNKMQGCFGETVLENILQAEQLRPGHDYESEYTLRDKNGNIILNEDSGKRMRPDFVLHFPDKTDILIDAKVSLTALSDYFNADCDAARSDASRRNLESVNAHVRELASKDYQKYAREYAHVSKTLEYVIMFIPNYGAYQLAKKEDPEIFNNALKCNVLITTEETLVPFLRLIRSAWVQKEQMDNVEQILVAAQQMVDRVGIFCKYNAEVDKSLESVLTKFRDNTNRLIDSKQSIVRAAQNAIRLGIKAPKNTIEQLMESQN